MTKVPYVTFMKHAQKVVKSPTCKSRPILGGVLHREGYIAVTDSHRLYFALLDEQVDVEKVICPKTGAEIKEGNYPDVVRLIPEPDSAKFTAKLDVALTAQAVKLIEQAGKVGKASDLVEIKRDMADVVFSTDDEALVSCEYVGGSNMDGESFELYASARYVKEAFELIKEAGFEEATFRYYGSTRPFTFIAGNLTALILPIRKQ